MENLKKESEKLAQDFEAIIKNHPDTEKADISNELMAKMCLASIYLPKEVVESYERAPKGHKITIDPAAAKLYGEITEEEKNNYYRIRAYSFGPFDPVEYFKSKVKILWLLKEPYCESINELNGTEIKDYRQALKNMTWKEAKKNTTLRNLIEYTKTLLEKLGIVYNGEEDEIMQQVMNHICILEVNHFPGLAFNAENDKSDENDKHTDNDKIKLWAEINRKLIKLLISFYSPNILIGGFTIRHFYNNILKFYLSTLKDYIDNGNKDLLSSIGIEAQDVSQHQKSPNYVIKGVLESDKSSIHVIAANHPSALFGQFKPEDALGDADLMKN